MATEAQIRANRQNATKSTGPRTEAGKTASSQNAVKHGGYSNRALAIQTGPFKEDPDQIADFIDAILEELKPRDALEHEEARRIATISLRYRRCDQFEAHAMSVIENEPVPRHAQTFHLLEGYESAEQAEHVQSEKIRITHSLGVLESVIATASRIGANNSRQLRSRDLDDPSDTLNDAPNSRAERAQFRLAT